MFAESLAHDTPPLLNIEAEQSVLGAVLTRNDLLFSIDAIVSAADFAEPVHQRIFDAASKLINQGKSASALTLYNYFEADKALAELGIGAAYLASLTASYSGETVSLDHARLVRALSVRRQVIEIAEDTIQQAQHLGIDDSPEALVQATQSTLDAVLGKESRRESVSLKEALQRSISDIEAAYTRQGEPFGLPTGIRALDHHMGGLEPSNLIILAGRPGMGKSALAMCIALNMAKRGDKGLFFSMEMSDTELVKRIIAGQTGVTVQDMKRGNINDASFRMIRDAQSKLDAVPLHIDQTGALTVQQLATRARRHHRLHGLDFMVVDYIQLMSGSGKRRGDNRTNEITEITMGLKALAKELNIPILALSQLSRSVEQRADKRPMLSDLRESGSIEQDADIVWFVYRDHYYLKDATPPKDAAARLDYESLLRESEGKAEVIVAKFRSGPTGTVFLAFDDATTTFRDREARRQ